ncbi:hypothetical protein CPC16_003860 [Podila verticillata]|nr:hypothetical protein CPC16_003860 [Podila verticillata]KAI9234122.1 MAG: hypothetical protein BYD32DRAFT_464710 [Podila humilis]KFH72271.1 hypothetical protein MVEG_02562 [Podila verticillata NRRL 6337]
MATLDRPEAEARLDPLILESSQRTTPSEWTRSISTTRPLSLYTHREQHHRQQYLQPQAASSDDAIARHTNTSQARSTLSANNIGNNAQIYPLSAAATSASRSNVAVAIGLLSEEACLEELYGPTAKTEEDIALQVGLELAARRKSSSHQSTQSSNGLSSRSSYRDLEGNDEVEDDGYSEHDLDDEEKDNCLSGICLPSSQFFQTSVICSNTMTRDGLANERTFLSWLSVSMSLCLVSFSFITRALTLDSVTDESEDRSAQKDKLSRWIGYVCFGCAFFAAIYSLLKYLRNIQRISTRYPFAQAGAWTFTVGMILGVLIMVALTLAYTENI